MVKGTSPNSREKSKAEVLAEAGVSTQDASRAEQVAEVPEEEFEAATHGLMQQILNLPKHPRRYEALVPLLDMRQRLFQEYTLSYLPK